MAYVSLKTEHDGRIGRVILNRPEKLNALPHDITWELPQAFDEMAADTDVRVVIFKGAGRAFSAGFDHSLNLEKVGWRDAAEETLASRDWISGLFKIWDCPKPVIAQLHGYAIGWGGLVQLFCDLRYASDEFKTFYAAGVTGAFLPEVWSWFIGMTAASEFAYRPNYRFTAQELLNLGLVNRIFPLAELEEKVEAIAAEIATTEPIFLRMQKLGLHRQWELRGFREAVQTTKDFDAMLHWSVLGQETFARLAALGGDRRKMADEQTKGAFWDNGDEKK